MEMGCILAYASLARALRALSSRSQPGTNPHRIKIKTTCWSGRYQNEERGAHFCSFAIAELHPDYNANAFPNFQEFRKKSRCCRDILPFRNDQEVRPGLSWLTALTSKS